MRIERRRERLDIVGQKTGLPEVFRIVLKPIQSESLMRELKEVDETYNQFFRNEGQYIDRIVCERGGAKCATFDAVRIHF